MLGTVCGGAISRFVLLAPDSVALNPATVASLQAQGITDAGAAFAPAALFGPEAWSNPLAVLTLLLGGLLVGPGTRRPTAAPADTPSADSVPPMAQPDCGHWLLHRGLTVTHFVLPHWLPIL